MSVPFVDLQTYTNSLETSFAVKPRQPIWGNRSASSVSAVTLFEYDIQTPYASGAFVVSNKNQDTRKMVGWGMIVHLALITDQAISLTILADLWDGNFVQIDTSPIAVALSAKVQLFEIPVIPCFQIRGQAQATGTTATITYHASLTDY